MLIRFGLNYLLKRTLDVKLCWVWTCSSIINFSVTLKEEKVPNFCSRRCDKFLQLNLERISSNHFSRVFLWRIGNQVQLFHWLIDWFNVMPTHRELFYAKRLENRVHCMFIFTCLCSCFLKVFFFFCTRSHQIRIIVKQIYFTHRWDCNRYNQSWFEWTWE